MERFLWHNQVFCIFFFYICFQVNCSSPSSFLCPPEQSFALRQFKNSIQVGSEPFCADDSSQKTTSSWTEGSDCCSWDGVTCHNFTGNVIGLDLHCSGLQGKIEDNSSLFHLSHLQWLNLAYNNFDGSKISPEFGRLSELTQFSLSCSNFYGFAPPEISQLSKLTLLDLSACGFGLTIDQRNFDLLAQNLTRLSVLNLDSVDMTAVNPSSLLNLSSSIKVLSLVQTGIKGKFPEEIFRLPNLQELYLRTNEGATGYFPKSNWSSPLRVLDLGGTNFKGEIPDSIGNLKFLEVIRIPQCNFGGTIAKSVGNLTRLTILDLKSNYFTGELPSLSKLEKVTQIYLANNKFSGSIPYISVNFSSSPSNNSFSAQLPNHVSRHSRLTFLDWSQNFFNGSVPSWLFTLPFLVYVDLADNMLTGLDQFKLPYYNSLSEVYLQNNNIHSPIPNSIFELENLTILDLSSNHFSGTIKFDMISRLKNLVYLSVSNNNLLSFSSASNTNYSLPKLKELRFSFCNVIEFPSFLRTAKNLELLDLSNNRIQGRISYSESDGWESLTYLDLSNNFLSYVEQHPWKNIKFLYLQNNTIQGSILVPPSSTQDFLVSNNRLTGQIPPSICEVNSLEHLSLSDNSLRGTIPPCLGNFTNSLVILHLQRNYLQGSIPDTWVTGSHLASLDLSENKLKGQFPRFLANCSQLEVLNVGNNMISDTFPCWLGTLSELKILILRSNKFYGPICDSKTIHPFHNLRIIDLSSNEFTGYLPTRIFASMEAMMNACIDESGVQQTGGIYSEDSVRVTWKGKEILIHRILTIFTSIDLSRNQFQGEIPEVLGKFKSLLMLNLSHNSLMGHIPVSFANLRALESLDLSFNNVDGRIPEQLKSLTFLSVLKVSNNSLSGPIPQGNQFNTFENNSFIGNKDLCGEPLSVKCDNDAGVVHPPPPSVSQEEYEIAASFDWKIAMMGYASGLVIGMSVGYIVFSTGKPQWLVRMVEERLMKKARKSSQKRRRTGN